MTTQSRSHVEARRNRGQILIIFALEIFVLVGIVAMVVDISWYWSNSLGFSEPPTLLHWPASSTFRATSPRQQLPHWPNR